MTTGHRSPARTTIAALGCALLLAACGSGDEPASPGPTPPPDAAEVPFVSLDELPEEIAAAIADASQRFDVPESEIAVAGARRITWSDGSLGCPDEGMMYTQALVPGYLLTLEVAGRRVEYHGADGALPFLCER